MSPPISNLRRERGFDVLERLREMAISYQLRPGEKLSEIELAQRLGVSRTPVREALARLVTDGFLQPTTRGFMRRPLQVQETLELYEARVAIESACLSMAVARASEEQIAQALAYLEASRKAPRTAPVERLVELDEGFHLLIADMAGNAELRRMLVNINERIRFIRWIDMENVGRDSTQREHHAILEALRARDAAACDGFLREHIGLRRDQIVAAITRGLAKIYLGPDAAAAESAPAAASAGSAVKPKAVKGSKIAGREQASPEREGS